VEGEETAVNTAVEEDVDPHVDLQGNGVSHPIMLKEDIFLTFSSSPLHTTLEAARTQPSPPVDTGTLAIEVPQSSSRANTALPPLDTPPPEEAAEPLISGLPKQIPAPVDVGELMESLTGEARQRTMRHKCQASAWALEGEEPLGEAHGCPPDLLDLRFEAPIVLEPDIVAPKARKPVFDEGARARPEPWPDPGAITIDSDVCSRASVLLEGEQNFNSPCVGSEQYAAQPAPQNLFPFSHLFDSRARGTAPGKGAAPVQRAADPHLEALPPPHLCEDPPMKQGE
jgi:hypothetical protein